MFAVPLRAIIIAIVIHALWGGNPVAIKFSLAAFPPLWTGFFRFLLGVICVVLWASFQRIRIWPNRDEWPALLLLGLVFTVQIGTMNFAVSLTTASMAAILIATNPLFAAIFAHYLVADDRLNWLRSLGLSIAFAGTVVVLLQDTEFDSLQLYNLGNWIMLFSAMLLGLRLSFSARLLRNIDTVRVVIWQMIFSLPLFAGSALVFETIQWHQISWPAIAGLLYQGLVIAGLGFMVNSFLMKHYRPSIMISFNFVSPIFGVLLSVMLLAESISWHSVIGVITVALGLFLITQR